ncbi:hypothetical protein EWK04_02430 [Salmonella enterica subsp. enterica serovar Java]|uniref:Uncharacterized protein n=1 Tax=Salmonella enterica subsp. enterica serovar Java TaxID=224729 RepID=A0A3Y9C523_SALEB|nr:hypothetical protein [Salmonella enterica subsp. enterica serovar Java]ECG3197645.1 hypothetical protein [Salmonella enterica subsp. enterica serovar Java]EDC4054133.1 hypothetical protein [Salmonella enterica subsp. enterica serovar Java]HCA3587711.1 hypothetical protein [Salmonella enterica subsp. enterica serovar Java]
MNELRIKRLLIVSVILNAILIFLFVQALSGNINTKKDVEKFASNVPIISPLCEFEKELDDNWKENFWKDPDNYREHNPAPCYWVNPITKKYFKFDKNITIMKDSTDEGHDYYEFSYANTPFIDLVYNPSYTANDSIDDFKDEVMSSAKIRLVTKGYYFKLNSGEKWIGSGFKLNKNGEDGDFGVFAFVKKENKFWIVFGIYNSNEKYDDKRTMKLIDDIIETL